MSAQFSFGTCRCEAVPPRTCHPSGGCGRRLRQVRCQNGFAQATHHFTLKKEDMMSLDTGFASYIPVDGGCDFDNHLGFCSAPENWIV